MHKRSTTQLGPVDKYSRCDMNHALSLVGSQPTGASLSLSMHFDRLGLHGFSTGSRLWIYHTGGVKGNLTASEENPPALGYPGDPSHGRNVRIS